MVMTSTESMFTVVVQIKKPEDVTLFEDYFWRVHLPLVKAIPDLKRIIVHKVTGTRQGIPGLYGLVELSFDDHEAFQKAMVSHEARHAMRDGSKLDKVAGTSIRFDYYCETTQL